MLLLFLLCILFGHWVRSSDQSVALAVSASPVNMYVGGSRRATFPKVPPVLGTVTRERLSGPFLLLLGDARPLPTGQLISAFR